MASTSSSVGSVTQPMSSQSGRSTTLRRNSNDIGWEFGMLVDPKNLDKVKCKLCGKLMSGGVYRIKAHVAHISGNVTPCPKATADDQSRCKQAIMEAKSKKTNKRKKENLLREEVNVGRDEKEMEELGAKKEPRVLGPMDKYALRINPNVSLNRGVSKMQENINDTLFKERTHIIQQYLARWVYEAGVPFNAIDNDNFKLFIKAVGQFGPGFRPPSQYQLKEPLLKEEVVRTKEFLKKHEEEWAKNGCSIIMNTWTSRKRSIMNFCVNCKEGTTFLSLKESSEEAHIAEVIFHYMDKCIEQIGPENVVQIVTDGTSNNMAAAKLLKETRSQIFWTSCATHNINLMLENIGKLPKFKKIIDQAKALTIFIYAHCEILSLMRSFTMKRDIVRPGVTRFASSFLTLQSLREKKDSLRTMFNSDAWGSCKWSKSPKGKMAYKIVTSLCFWNGVTLCLKVFSPLVRVLQSIDREYKPSMGFLYGELKQVKNDIKEALNNVESNYQLIFQIIDQRMQDRLDSPLHLAAYLLNPFYLYKDESIALDDNVIDGLFTCVEVFFKDDVKLQCQIINVELNKYRNKDGKFGKIWAIKGCEKNDENYDPVNWWETNGIETPNLQKMAIRILSLTTSSSECERNLNTFEVMHTKKKNRLDGNQLNNLVFVQFNSMLRYKQKKEKESNVDVLSARDASTARGWIVDGSDDDNDEVETNMGLTWGMVGEASGVDEELQLQKSSGGRELHENDFISEDEMEEENNVNFESDEERVLEECGEEEFDT